MAPSLELCSGWGVESFSKAGVTFSHVGGPFNLSVPPLGMSEWSHLFEIGVMCCMLSPFHVSSWNDGLHHWVIPSPLSIALEALLQENITRKLLSLSLDLFFKILLFQVAFLVFFSMAIFSPYFLLVYLLLQYVAVFQSRELIKY